MPETTATTTTAAPPTTAATAATATTATAVTYLYPDVNCHSSPKPPPPPPPPPPSPWSCESASPSSPPHPPFPKLHERLSPPANGNPTSTSIAHIDRQTRPAGSRRSKAKLLTCPRRRVGWQEPGRAGVPHKNTTEAAARPGASPGATYSHPSRVRGVRVTQLRVARGDLTCALPMARVPAPKCTPSSRRRLAGWYGNLHI